MSDIKESWFKIPMVSWSEERLKLVLAEYEDQLSFPVSSHDTERRLQINCVQITRELERRDKSGIIKRIEHLEKKVDYIFKVTGITELYIEEKKE